MSDKITDAEIVADLDSAIARLENSDSGWACVDAMKAARARISAASDMLAALQDVQAVSARLVAAVLDNDRDAMLLEANALNVGHPARSRLIAKATGA